MRRPERSPETSRVSTRLRLLPVTGLVIAALAVWLLGTVSTFYWNDINAGRELSRLQLGEFPVTWEMDSAHELNDNLIRGFESPIFESGKLTLRASATRGSFVLRQFGRAIPTWRYPRLRIELESNTELTLRLFYNSIGGETIPIGAGSTTIDVNLADMNYSRAGEPALSAPPWGTRGVMANSLQFYWHIHPDTVVTLNRISLFRPEGFTLPSAEPLPRTEERLSDAIRRSRSGNEVALFSAGHQFGSAEDFLYHRDRINDAVPDAVVFWGAPKPASTKAPGIPAFAYWLLAAALLLFSARSNQASLTTALLLICSGFLLMLGSSTFGDPESHELALGTSMLYLAIRVSHPGLTPFRRPGSKSNWAVVSLLTLPVAALLMVPAGIDFLLNRPGSLDIHPRHWIVLYPLWALFQQWLVATVFYPAFAARLGRHPDLAALSAATVFGLAHFPNPLLMATTTVLGYLWLNLFRASGSLWPGTLSHTLLGITALVFLPPQVMHSGTIGAAFVLG